MAPKKKYTPEQMAGAVAAVLSQGASVNSAAKRFSVPRITLHNKISGKSPLVCSMGPTTILTPTEEELLVKWVIAMGERFPISKDHLLDSVQRLVTQQDRSTPFAGNRPGKKWYSAFIKRHPILTERTAENISSSRDAVTEDQINNWFKEVKIYLNENNLSGILEDPTKIFNTDESAFFLSPKPGRVLVKRGAKNVYMSSGDEKENVTVLLTANAAGKVAPPMIVYAYDRIPANIAKKVPEKWAIGKSDSGWMCSDTFFEYISNVFNPWLIEEDIQKPVLLFVDGHKSHLTLHLSNYCSENGIEIIALYPNSTHILQPMDIAVFRPLKLFYRKAMVQWKMENNGNKLKKEDFALVLKNALHLITEDCIKNGFRGGGLYPFGPEYMNFTKIRNQDVSNENTITDQQHFLKYLEMQIVQTFGQDKLALYNRFYFIIILLLIEGRNDLDHMALEEDQNLYILWAHNKQKAIVPYTDITSTASDNNASSSTFRQSMAITASSESFIHHNTPDIVVFDDAGPMTCQHEPMASTSASDPSIHQNTSDKVTSDDAHQSTSSLRPTAPTAPTSASKPFVQNATVSSNSVPVHNTPEKTRIDSTTQKNAVEFVNVHDILSPFTISIVQSDINPNKDGCTPHKNTLSNVLGINVPSPFKKCLFWPEDLSKKKNIRNKDKVPSAVTSQAWQRYHQNKEEEKRKILKEKELRAKQRLEKKLEKLEIEKKKKKKISIKKKKAQDSSSEDTDVEIPYNESDDSEYNVQMDKEDLTIEEFVPENKPENNLQNKRKRTKDSESETELPLAKLKTKNSEKNLEKGYFVIIMYEGEYFPGMIENTDRGRYEVSTMTLSTGNTFRWPERPDKIWYPTRDVIEIINPPVKLNNRGFYKVIEMEKYLPDLYNYVT